MSRPISAARRNRSHHVLANLDKLVVKAVGESGGYGMLVGPHATPGGARGLRARSSKPIPRTTSRSRRSSFPPRRPSWTAASKPRHVDLRPFILHGEETHDRARRADARGASKRGSLVVNSSQGGGSKDTWVLSE